MSGAIPVKSHQHDCSNVNKDDTKEHPMDMIYLELPVVQGEVEGS